MSLLRHSNNCTCAKTYKISTYYLYYDTENKYATNKSHFQGKRDFLLTIIVKKYIKLQYTGNLILYFYNRKR